LTFYYFIKIFQTNDTLEKVIQQRPITSFLLHYVYSLDLL